MKIETEEEFAARQEREKRVWLLRNMVAQTRERLQEQLTELRQLVPPRERKPKAEKPKRGRKPHQKQPVYDLAAAQEKAGTAGEVANG